jgi:hypothetical protein
MLLSDAPAITSWIPGNSKTSLNLSANRARRFNLTVAMLPDFDIAFRRASFSAPLPSITSATASLSLLSDSIGRAEGMWLCVWPSSKSSSSASSPRPVSSSSSDCSSCSGTSGISRVSWVEGERYELGMPARLERAIGRWMVWIEDARRASETCEPIFSYCHSSGYTHLRHSRHWSLNLLLLSRDEPHPRYPHPRPMV